MKITLNPLGVAAAVFALAVGYAPPASAHCDTLDGPVVAAACTTSRTFT